MPKRSEFVDFVVEQLALLGEVSAKSMFGGWGIFHEGRMFGLVADDTLYFKVDDTTRADFVAAGLSPFRYGRRDLGEAVLPYYEAPASAIDDRTALCVWGQKGIDAAQRAAAKKKPRARK